MEKQARTAAFFGEGLQEADRRSRLPQKALVIFKKT